MNPAQWQKVEKVVEDALQRAPQERAAFVAEACAGDTPLREEVESLLAHDAAAGDFLEHPPVISGAEQVNDATTSLVGQTISSYEIIGELGHGGMGTVYLARDAKLGRKVALKLLPEHLTNDEDRVRRFRHEARAASALNHPNILTVHEFGRAGQTFFLATEFVDGQTLRERMATSLTLGAGLEILLEVARALDAAHTAGIVHRDIKPENIMIRHDGYVKVLDFGLAKLTEQAEADSPAATTFHTRPGFLMGTPNYMSPEQLRGEAVDGRTDIWSLGVVIHEIITNLTPRDSSPVTRSLGLQTRREASLDNGDATALADLRLVATKATSRDKEARYQTAQDLMTDLIVIKQSYDFGDATRLLTPEALKAHTRHAATRDGRIVIETGGGAVRTARLNDTRPASSINPTANKPLAFAILLIIAASLGVLYWRSIPSTVERTPTSPANSIQFKRLAVTDQITESVISPDGKYLATVDENAGKQSISIRQVAAPGNKQTIVPPNLRYSGLTFSPDGNHVYFLGSSESEMTLFRVSTLGGTPRKLIADVHTAVTFSPDGRQLAFVRREPGASTLIIADADGTGERELAKRTGRNVFGTSGDLYHRPAWSPDGKVIICSASNQDGSLGMSLIEVDVANGSTKQFNTRPCYVIGQIAWLSDGSGLVMRAVTDASQSTVSQLWLINYPNGEARRLTNDLSGYKQVSLADVSDLLLTTQISYVTNVWMVSGKEMDQAELLASSKNKGNAGIAWTSEGNLLYNSDESGNSDIWIMDARGGNSRQLTFGKAMEIEPAADPTGKYVAFSSHGSDGTHVWRVNMDGTGLVQLTFGAYEDSPQISPDGRWVVYYSESESSRDEIWRVPIEGGEPFKLSTLPAKYPSVSPNGKLIACFVRDEQINSPWKIGIIPSGGGAPVKTFDVPHSVAEQTHGMRWTPDGRALTYIHHDAGVSNIWRQELIGGAARQLTRFTTDKINAFAWSPDNRLACVRRSTVTNLVLVSQFRP